MSDRAGTRVGHGRTGYGWVVVIATMLVNATMQMLWVTYTPVTQQAADYYHVSTDAIGLLAIVFMIAFLPLSIPSSALIGRLGIRYAVGLGSIVAAVGGLLRGLAGTNYTLAMAATLVIAAAQPLLLNCWTTVAGHWFAPHRRALAVSLITLANLLGTAVGGVLTPMLIDDYSLAAIQFMFGTAAAVAAALFVIFVRDGSPEFVDAIVEEPLGLVGQLRRVWSVRPVRVILVIFFIGLGIFNGVTTWIELIIAPRGHGKDQAGLLIAVMLAGGVLGALAFGALSDRDGRRIRWLTIGLGLGTLALLLFAVVSGLPALVGSAFLLGFFITGISPVAMQYAAEVTAPIPEGVSNGLLQLAGQFSFVLILAMSLTSRLADSYTPALFGLALLLAGCTFLVMRMPEPRR